jgi:hypothetical protein
LGPFASVARSPTREQLTQACREADAEGVSAVTFGDDPVHVVDPQLLEARADLVVVDSREQCESPACLRVETTFSEGCVVTAGCPIQHVAIVRRGGGTAAPSLAW